MQNTNCFLVAVVVTFNRLDKLKVTIDRLLQSAPGTLQAVVVINNASTDGTRAWLDNQNDSRLHVINSIENIGGAGGFDLGMRAAIKDFQPEWLVVMDDDARPIPGALEAFVATSHAEFDALASAVYFPSGEICEMNRPSQNPFWNLRTFLNTVRKGRAGFHITDESYNAGTARRIDVTSFVGFFVSNATIVTFGYPDPSLFIYGDDTLYTLNISSGGGRIVFAPNICFEHDFTSLEHNSAAQIFTPMWKLYYHNRNLLFLYKRAAGWFFPLILVPVLIKWFLKIKGYRGQKKLFLKLFWISIHDGLRDNRSRSHPNILALCQTAQPR